MKNPKQEHFDFEVTGGMTIPINNELGQGKKVGDATRLENPGRKGNIINIEESMDGTVKDHQINYNRRKKSAVRILENGEIIPVNDSRVNIEEIYKRQKNLGKVEHVEDKNKDNDDVTNR